MKFYYHVDHAGEEGAGIRAYSETVCVELTSGGEPGGDPGEFEEHMKEALSDWFDGAVVTKQRLEQCPICLEPSKLLLWNERADRYVCESCSIEIYRGTDDFEPPTVGNEVV